MMNCALSFFVAIAAFRTHVEFNLDFVYLLTPNRGMAEWYSVTHSPASASGHTTSESYNRRHVALP